MSRAPSYGLGNMLVALSFSLILITNYDSVRCEESTLSVSAQEVVARMVQRTSAIENFHSIATWKYFETPKASQTGPLVLIRSEIQEVHSDNLNRISIIARPDSSDNTLNAASMEFVENRVVYDGEKTMTMEYYPNRSRTGGEYVPTKIGTQSIAKPGYRTAMVHDGPFPLPNGPWMLNNPLTFMDGVRRAVEGCLADAKSVVVEDLGNGSVKLTYEPIPAKNPWKLHYEATVNISLGGVVTRYSGLTERGDKVIESECEYKNSILGLAVPVKGFWRNWRTGTPSGGKPASEKTFHVSVVEVNDPQFATNAFDVELPPDTAVSDIRYGVNYRVGSEKVIDDQLAALAKQAKEAADIPESDAHLASYWPLRTWLAVVVALAILIAIMVIGIRRWMW